MAIAILECGKMPESLCPRFGSYADMVGKLMGEGKETRTFDITAGEWPAEISAFEAYALTGSPAGVYDDLPWIMKLMDFLRQARGQAKVVGVCFGHQAMAQAFGGHVVKSPKGWGVGRHRYEVKASAVWMARSDGAGQADAIAAPASHQDQVVVAPPGSRTVLASAFTPFAGLDYGDAISFQFHPEFSADFAQALIEATYDRYPDGMADSAIASYAQPLDCERVAGWIGQFLQSN
jgi:GMP synthase-like glutamine amidotransferase